MAQPESKLSRAIKDHVRARGGYCIKIHGGPTMEAGTPDLLACLPLTIGEAIPDGIGIISEDRVLGLFVGIETKMPSGGDPTAIQEHRHNQIRSAGGVVIVARSVQDVSKALTALGVPLSPGTPS